MDGSKLHGPQYVRVGANVAERIAPRLGISPLAICELVIDLVNWPEEIQPLPMKGWNGILIAGDPVLLDATERGLIFPSGSPNLIDMHERTVLVPWEQVRNFQVLGREAAMPLV